MAQSGPFDASDPLFHVCWRRQSCSSCLSGDVACSWCPISSTCVPNPARLPIFSPIRSSHLCPLGSKERWELRAAPFGCNVSTLTVLSVLVAVLSSLALAGLVYLVVWAVQRLRSRWKDAQYERLDDGQGLEPTSCGCQDWGLLAWLLSLVGGQGQDQAQASGEPEEENNETSPLLN
ncbi:hypothetical protein N7510_004449 [Penicillium lagena]|uniref:uncharacterized protein n=1 Tax=Penicillium lagena TaxID=94218 RepID=UPI00254022C2|nr:uncharacterized protein N7510_004449 [Penicillium lagena]KAJ5620465.1 hypothetical protein N7510_004449 [Penicillium lagena]